MARSVYLQGCKNWKTITGTNKADHKQKNHRYKPVKGYDEVRRPIYLAESNTGGSEDVFLEEDPKNSSQKNSSLQDQQVSSFRQTKRSDK